MSFLAQRFVCWLVLCGCAVSAVLAQSPAPAPDVLIFANGDQLRGKLVRASGGNVVFKSDMAGELTVRFSKIRELRSSTHFVALRKSERKLPVTGAGPVDISGTDVVLSHEAAPADTIPAKDLAFLLDEATYEKQLGREPGFFHAWTGTITAGASLARSTQNSASVTAGVALVRAVPSVPYLSARNRTILNATESFGRLTSPVLPPTAPPSPDVVVRSSIFHADTERDQYFSPRAYALADASFDHNYAQGLQLQQIYGGGIGWTVLKSARQQLDIKADGHYEIQQYFSANPGAPASPAVHLFGSTFGEMYHRDLPRKIVFTETANYLPAWTEFRAYSANVSGTLALPVSRRFSASLAVADEYLNDPQPFYRKNSFQFVTGLTYSLP